MRADPRQPGGRHVARELRVFGEEAVTGMDRLRAGSQRDVDDFWTVEIAPRRCGRTKQIRLVGHAHVKRVAIRLGIDGDRFDAHFTGGPRNPDRDFAAIGD